MAQRNEVALSGVKRGGKRSREQQAAYLDLQSDSSHVDDSAASSSSGDSDVRLRQTAALLSGEEDELDDDNDEEQQADADDATAGWGKKKFTYYQNREEESSSAEELEEEEAQRIQQLKNAQMAESDFALPGLNIVKKAAAVTPTSAKGGKKSEAEVVKVTKAKEEALETEELAALLQDMKAKAEEVKETLRPLLEKAKSGEIVTNNGIGFLELKHHLLLNYCLNLNFYLLLKLEGKTVKDHPVIDELVRLRLLIEKTRPIEEKLKPQIDRLLKTAAFGAEVVERDEAMMRANPSQMLQGSDEGKEGEGQEEEDEVELYRPPKATAMHFELEERRKAKDERREKRLKERASKSNIMRMVREEFGDEPEALRTQVEVLEDEQAADDLREQAREVQEYEEERFLRLQRTKDDRKRTKRDVQFVDQLKRLDDFGDVERVLKLSRKKGQTGEEFSVQKDGSGPLSEMARRLREAQRGEGDEEDDEQEYGGGEDEEDALGNLRIRRRDLEAEKAYEQFLEESKAKREAKKKQRYQDNPNARRKAVEVEVAGADGKRGISTDIERNKGTRTRSKHDIARVRHKKKFTNAEKRRAGMVRKVRKETTKYAGERGGINVNVVRSTKLK